LAQSFELVPRHCAKELARFRGRETNTTGDGFLATFDGRRERYVARSQLRSGQTTRYREIAGAHTGECELMGDNVGGIAVTPAHASWPRPTPESVLVSRTVKDLVSGSGIKFQDHGVPARVFPTVGLFSGALLISCRQWQLALLALSANQTEGKR
jgi:class 3 adenylate cyclase